jgi:hypothetical protein
MHIQALDFRMQLPVSRDGSVLNRNFEQEFRDELQSQVSQLMNGALL